jgi:8-hydroxy-5-deazaflavin:NADPH oxidoreductase
MLHKETIAVIGATGEEGRKAIGYLLRDDYRLLLVDESADRLAQLQQELLLLHPAAAIDTLPCCREASWEADIIILAKAQKTLTDTVRKIREVAANKIIISIEGIPELHYDQLQGALPHSQVVEVQWKNAQANPEVSVTPQLKGNHPAAVKTAAELFQQH